VTFGLFEFLLSGRFGVGQTESCFLGTRTAWRDTTGLLHNRVSGSRSAARESRIRRAYYKLAE
jgi:hypothetical protein